MKGLASMKYDPKAKPVTKPAKPSVSAKGQAIREAVTAIKDGDVDGAVKALEIAIRECVEKYGG